MTKTSSRVSVAPEVILDGRLALFHERERWLAVADVHFGYELSHRAAGNLFPLWGMRSAEARLEELLRDYAPRQLLILGDFVHDQASRNDALRLLEEIEARFCPVILLAGNHDRGAFAPARLREEFAVGEFRFHHGDCRHELADRCIQVIGHHHPAGVLRDGVGLRLKLPALVQTRDCWIMPAFSPWAAGTEWRPNEESRVWLCSPSRIFPPRAEAA